MKPPRPLAPVTLTCIALLAASAARAAASDDDTAPNGRMRYASVDMRRDARHDQSLIALLSLPVGTRGWVQASAGQARDAQDALSRSPLQAGGAAGYLGSGWQAALSASRRADGATFRQTDWRGLVEARGDRWDAGLDASWREASQAGTASVPGLLGGPTDVPVSQRVRGGGLGVHGDLPITASIGLAAAAMGYHYRVVTQQTGTGGSGSGLGGVLQRALRASPSLVSRDEATLTRSAMVGVNDRFQGATVSAEVDADQVYGGSTMVTTQLKAAINLTSRCTVTPAIGQTRSSAYGQVGFAGLTLTAGW